MIEKLLRSCPDVAKVYILVREKKGVLPQERAEKMCEGELFCRLKKEQPDFAKKVVAIPAELSEPAFGLSDAHAALLADW